MNALGGGGLAGHAPAWCPDPIPDARNSREGFGGRLSRIPLFPSSSGGFLLSWSLGWSGHTADGPGPRAADPTPDSPRATHGSPCWHPWAAPASHNPVRRTSRRCHHCTDSELGRVMHSGQGDMSKRAVSRGLPMLCIGLLLPGPRGSPRPASRWRASREENHTCRERSATRRSTEPADG